MIEYDKMKHYYNMKDKIITLILLIFIFILALFLRVYFCYNAVFSEPIKYSFDDGVYHMRLVENELLGGHFPWRIGFDPFTYFPYGTYIHFAPLYDFILALIIWLLSFGKPTLQLINSIAPFIPAVMGSLVVVPAYFIGKCIWNSKIGVLSAFLIAISPPFLSRSLLGNTDHHVGEMFFSVLAMVFLFLLVDEIWKKENFDLKQVIKEKKLWTLTLLTGLVFGSYFLVWIGAVIFLLITFLFFVFYYLLQYCRGKNKEWILLPAIIIFAISFLMITPWLGNPNLFLSRLYNFGHVLVFSLGIFSLIFLYVAGYFGKKYKIKTWIFLTVLLLCAILFLVFLKLFMPLIFNGILGLINGVNNSIAENNNSYVRNFIGEMMPMRISGAFGNFSSFFYIALLSLIIIIYQFVKNKDPKKLLLIIWTLAIALMSGIVPFFGQNRFAMYLSLNVALLASFLLIKALGFGWSARNMAKDFPEKSFMKFYFSVTSYLVLFCVAFFFLYPLPFNLGNGYPGNLPWLVQAAINTAKSPIINNEDWYETLGWVKNNTPDPGLDYYAFYSESGIDKKTNKIIPYSYPDTAYGILSYWDVGHMITYYTHRIPIANPFTQGIGLKKNGQVIEPGEGVFFLETEEKNAIKYLDELRAKYVILDNSMSEPSGKFQSYAMWIQGNIDDYTNDKNVPNKFDRAMSTRLYFFDGSGVNVKGGSDNETHEFYLDSLDHFRLIHESKNSVFLPLNDYYKPFNLVKVFEYVKGARITGKIKSKGKAIISTEIETNQGRKFTYQKETQTENGVFEFIVPYSTFGKDGRIPTGTQFAVFAKSYKITVAGKEFNINVTEEDVLNGKEIKLF